MNALSLSDEWSTPADLFAALRALYGPFHVDVASSDANAKCANHFTKRDSALERSWRVKGQHTRAWDNPPYSRGSLARWMEKARAEVLAHHVELVTNLVPHYTAECWWQRHVEGAAGKRLLTSSGDTNLGPRTQVCWESLTVEVLRLRGRVRFIEASGRTGAARYSSAVVTFAQPGVLPPLVLRRRPGPKRIVTPEVEATIRAAVDNGASIVAACEAGGVSRKTWYRHLERNLRREA